MNDADEAPDRRLHPVVYWLIVLAIAVCLGVSAPAFFLLGFWEMAPLVLLYELSIMLSRVVYRRRRVAEAAAGAQA